MRTSAANTTAALREQSFSIVIAPGLDGTASGSLYLDDGESLVQAATSEIEFTYANGSFSMTGSFGYDAGVAIESITLLGVGVNGTAIAGAAVGREVVLDGKADTASLKESVPLTGAYSVKLL